MAGDEPKGGLRFSEGQHALGLEATKQRGCVAVNSGTGLLEDAVGIAVAGVLE